MAWKMLGEPKVQKVTRLNYYPNAKTPAVV